MTEQPDLLGSESRWHLTNRFNLLGILSSRIVGPREAYDKYYRDVLELTPGWVPLTCQLPHRSLVEWTTAEPASFPVLLEIECDRATCAAVQLVPAVLTRQVKAVHFPDERALREHKARVYENVPDQTPRLTVSPRLFEFEAGTRESEIVAAGRPTPSEVDWRRLDRWRGAVAAMALAARREPELDLLYGVLSRVAGAHWITRALNPDGDTAGAASTNEIVMRASTDVFMDAETAVDWSARRILELVKGRVSASPLSNDERDHALRNLETVRQIVDNERDFIPFSNRPGALDAAKALLLALLRPDPARLATWSPVETGAPDDVQMAALALVGALRGVASMSATQRTVALDDYTAAAVLAGVTGVEVELPELERGVREGAQALLVDGSLIAQAGQPVAAGDALLAVPGAARGAVAAAIATELGWDDAVSTLAKFKSSVSVRAAGQSLEVRSSSPPVVTYEFDESSFIKRLNGLDEVEIRRVRAIIAAADALATSARRPPRRRAKKAAPKDH
jgi:hypothetical protein